MAKSISLLLLIPIIFLLLSVQSGATFLTEDDDYEEYVVDYPAVHEGAGLVHYGRLLQQAAVMVVKKGTHCNVSSNPCNGVWANKGKSLLNCCKKHCRNILGDRNNCGVCGHKCGFGQRCCGGRCTEVGSNASHCGKCKRACASGVKCEHGVCGYA